jgi:hypothetical protein
MEDEMGNEVSFKVSPADHALIMKAVDRFESFIAQTLGHPVDRLSLMMDLTACHANGNPLRLRDLVETEDDFSFVHDVGGIRRHINRDTGKLENCFSPRFSRRADIRAA